MCPGVDAGSWADDVGYADWRRPVCAIDGPRGPDVTPCPVDGRRRAPLYLRHIVELGEPKYVEKTLHLTRGRMG